MKWLIGIAYLYVLIGIFFLLWSRPQIRGLIVRSWKKLLIFALINAAVMSLLLFLHLRQESFIAYWDFSGFWRNTLLFKAMLDRSISEAMTNVYQSILNSEYNYVSEWFLYPLIRIIGDTYPRYVISVYLTYMIPANLLLYLSLLYLEEKGSFTQGTARFIALVIMTFGSNLYPLIQGYIGSAGLAIIIALTLLMIDHAYDELNIGLSAATGFYLLLLLVIRRWYAYWIVSFFIAWLLRYLLLDARKKGIPGLKGFLLNYAACGGTALGLLLLCFFQLFHTITTYDYSSAYSVMQLGGPLYITVHFIEWYGIIPVLLMICGLCADWHDAEQRTIHLCLLVQILLCIILFNRVQVFGSHHYYIISIPCLFLIMDGILWLSRRFREKVVIPFCAVSVVICFNFTQTTVFSHLPLESVYQVTESLTSRPLPYLRINQDKSQIISLANYLNAVSGDYQYIYVLASSEKFNDDMLRNAFLPDDLIGVRNLLKSSAYDERDGISSSFFQDYYVIVCDPVQIQFTEDKQRCVTVLADFMLHDSRVSSYYKVAKELTLASGVKLKVFQRIEQVPNSIRQEISDQLKSYYPDNPKMYTFDMLSE